MVKNLFFICLFCTISLWGHGPAIISIAPTSGPLGGGIKLKIEGIDLACATDVKLNGMSHSFSVITLGTLELVMPPMANDELTVNIQVFSSECASNIVQFSYVPPPIISKVKWIKREKGQMFAMVQGSGFSDSCEVSFILNETKVKQKDFLCLSSTLLLVPLFLDPGCEKVALEVASLGGVTSPFDLSPAED